MQRYRENRNTPSFSTSKDGLRLHKTPRRLALAGLTAAVVTCSSQVYAESEEVSGSEERGRHCLGEQRSKFVIHQLLGGQYNPWGAENTMSIGICSPLITRPGILFDYTNIEVGLVSILSPVYNHVGPYLQLTPLSVLQLRVEMTWVAYWPFFFDRAGFYGREGYGDDYRNSALPSENAETATGWNISFSAVLRARVPIGPVAIVLYDQLTYEHWSLGDEPFYVNLKRDLIFERMDWVLTNEAILCVEIPLNSNLNLRVGGFDSLRYLPRSGGLNNLVGGMVMLNIPRGGRTTRDVSPFVRVGGYSHHSFRRGEVSAVVGLTMSYDVASIPTR